MRKMSIFVSVLATVLTVGFAQAAFAANLVNKDAKKYEIDLSCDGATTHTSIAANATQLDSISDGCVVKLKVSNATFKVSGSHDVVIKNGKLSAGESNPENKG